MDRLPPAGHHLRRRDYAKRRGWTVSIEANEVGSGTNTRPKREEILKAARRRELDAVVVWRLDRWGRSLIDLIGTLQELDGLGVGFVSLSEALDMTTPSGRALAVFAEFARYSQRSRQGRYRRGSESWQAPPMDGQRPCESICPRFKRCSPMASANGKLRSAWT